jgi:hypothetical protein
MPFDQSILSYLRGREQPGIELRQIHPCLTGEYVGGHRPRRFAL